MCDRGHLPLFGHIRVSDLDWISCGAIRPGRTDERNVETTHRRSAREVAARTPRRSHKPDDLANLSDLTVQLNGGGARGEMGANHDLWIGIESQSEAGGFAASARACATGRSTTRKL
jgi:hypothetical protein